jgi:predicted nucleic acid-binding protein
MSQIVKLFMNGRSQAVRLPAAYRFKEDEVYIRRTTVLPWDREAAQHYGALRAEMKKRGAALAPVDKLIAAHARSRNAILVSIDAAFQRAPDLQVENWMTPV